MNITVEIVLFCVVCTLVERIRSGPYSLERIALLSRSGFKSSALYLVELRVTVVHYNCQEFASLNKTKYVTNGQNAPKQMYFCITSLNQCHMQVIEIHFFKFGMLYIFIFETTNTMHNLNDVIFSIKFWIIVSIT